MIIEIGLGLIFQVPMIGAQASVKISDLSSVSTMLLVSFNQRRLLNLGCTSSIRNLIFLSVPNRANDVNPAEVLAAAPVSLRKAFTSEQLPGVTCHAWCIQEAQGHHRKIRRKHVVTVMVWGIGEHRQRSIRLEIQADMWLTCRDDRFWSIISKFAFSLLQVRIAPGYPATHRVSDQTIFLISL